MVIRVNLNPLEETTAFPYLGRTFKYNNSDWVALYINLRKDHRRWGMVEKVMGERGVPINAWTMMYKLVVQSVLLYGSKILVATNTVVMFLKGFHNKISRRIEGETAQRGDIREW